MYVHPHYGILEHFQRELLPATLFCLYFASIYQRHLEPMSINACLLHSYGQIFENMIFHPELLDEFFLKKENIFSFFYLRFYNKN